jgi:transcriptional regulator with XRE-family HTH domain
MPTKIELPAELVMERQRDGDRIRGLRSARGWNQDQLAEAAGVDRNTVSRIETGSRGLSINAYYLIAQALEVPLWRLFRDE